MKINWTAWSDGIAYDCKPESLEFESQPRGCRTSLNPPSSEGYLIHIKETNSAKHRSDPTILQYA